MPTDKLSRYVEETRTYMESARGKANWLRNLYAYGMSYQRNLAAAVMTATHLIVYERIQAVVEALQEERVAA